MYGMNLVLFGLTFGLVVIPEVKPCSPVHSVKNSIKLITPIHSVLWLSECHIYYKMSTKKMKTDLRKTIF